MAVTLRDVASLAGVSVKTVSNVVNGYAFVKADNRRRVEEALAATGYRPNVGARNLRRGRTGFIGLMVPELSVPYFAELTALVITAAQRHDWNVLIEQSQGTRAREQSSLAALGPHLIDGAIVSPEALEADDLRRLGPGVPLVMLGEHAVDFPIDRVAIDNVRAAREAVGHLAAMGRRRIAAIGANPHRGTAALRLAGYRAALADAGLPEDNTLVAPALNYHRRDGAQAMAALLDGPAPPDAVFCFNDLLALGALRTLLAAGLRVPEDVAIVGVDDIEDGRFSTPTLTTVAPDKAQIAGVAVAMLLERINGLDCPPREVTARHTLLVRESTASGA